MAFRIEGRVHRGDWVMAAAIGVCALLFGASASGQTSCSTAFTLAPVPAHALPPTNSLPTGTPRPGPEILYAPLFDAPQLQNTAPWAAAPILISGASAYRQGEFLYQDFLYDDAGARGTSTNAGVGTYTYPTNAIYVGNAADFVEVRIKPLADGTAVRITYNSMLNPELVATTLAFGGAPPQTWPMPHGANVRAPGDVFVTVHGSTGDIVVASSGVTTSSAPTVVVDTTRRQVHLCIPYAAYDPRGKTAVRVAAGTGLWDVANGRYLLPAQTATATTPGGANPTILPNPPAFFNVAFRYTEPLNAFANAQQGTSLRTGDLSTFFANVDFTALAQGVNNDMPGQVGGVPQTGYMDRILASHFEDAQGRGNAASLRPDMCPAMECPAAVYAGRLQPYEIYVPSTTPPYGLLVHPHASGGSHNFYIESGRTVWQPEAAAKGLLSFTPLAKGPTYWYYGEAGAEVFEVWADVAARYQLDPSNTVLGGLSMGGYGTLKLGSQFPDLFSSAIMVVPCVSAGGWALGTEPPAGQVVSLAGNIATSLRNVPQYAWTGTADTLCQYWAQTKYFTLMDLLGYRYTWYSFIGVPHPGFDNEFQPMIDWIDGKRVVTDPAHVTYVLNEEMNDPEHGLTAGHAYWISGLTLRDATVDPPLGKIDVFSHGFGVKDPVANPTQNGSGVFVGPYTKGQNTVNYTVKSRDWRDAAVTTAQNQLDIVAQNIATVTIYPARARVDCNAVLNVQSDGPVTVQLAGCGPGTTFFPQ